MKAIKDMDFSWSRLAVEALVIMLSGLLGFVLNAWRESMNEQETVDVALRSIAVEACYNKQELGSRQSYYYTLRDTLVHLAAERGANTALRLSEVPGFSGIDLPTVRSSSFEPIRATGAITTWISTLPVPSRGRMATMRTTSGC